MPKCDFVGCTVADKEFSTPAAVGSHKWRAHGVGGSSRAAKAMKEASATPRPRRRKPARKIRRMPVEEPIRNGSGAAGFVRTLRDAAEEHEKKAERLRTLAAELEEELQTLF